MPISDGEFKYIHLNNNLTQSVEIGFRFTLKVRFVLIECLQANANIFFISPQEMPDIDPSVA